jgi:hypothetical protein
LYICGVISEDELRVGALYEIREYFSYLPLRNPMAPGCFFLNGKNPLRKT